MASSSALASLMLLSMALVACGQTKKDSATEPTISAPLSPKNAFVPLSGPFLQRATDALARYLQFDSLILEIRAEGREFTLQSKASAPLAKKLGSNIVQFKYSETPAEPGQPPIGRVESPIPVPIQGMGDLEENLYRFDELNLPQMARAFSVAKRAIDPADGQIERLVVRRYLPFSERIRGRIFVRSPRMNGSIDVNEKGQPLRR